MPLADRMRPRALGDVVGLDHRLGPDTLLGAALRSGVVPSVILWGPPGCGKTTLGRLLAEASGRHFHALSAVTAGIKDVRQAIATARAQDDGGLLLFVDEIHRFNRAQQDGFLPHIEDGTIILVGATTENPGFALRRALLSRVRVVQLQPLDDAALRTLAERALADREQGLAGAYTLDEDALTCLIEIGAGDARRLLNTLESAATLAGSDGERANTAITPAQLQEAAQVSVVAYDASGDDRYDLLSAFHKSLRGSDADAALFWMARMLGAGEDPRVIVRRLIAMASEDIGLADHQALPLALAAAATLDRLGQPEGELALAHAVIHAATAPKSNSVVRALAAARRAAAAHPSASVPLQIRNAPTPLAKSLGHGAGYRYPHDDARAAAAQHYLPDGLRDLSLYTPNELGAERETAKRWRWWKKQASEGAARDR